MTKQSCAPATPRTIELSACLKYSWPEIMARPCSLALRLFHLEHYIFKFSSTVASIRYIIYPESYFKRTIKRGRGKMLKRKLSSERLHDMANILLTLKNRAHSTFACLCLAPIFVFVGVNF